LAVEDGSDTMLSFELWNMK